MRLRHALVRISVGVLMLAAPGGIVTARQAQAQANPLEAQIEALERQRHEALIRGDVDFLDRQTSEDYTTVNGAGCSRPRRRCSTACARGR